jgi:hypothetical protein
MTHELMYEGQSISRAMETIRVPCESGARTEILRRRIAELGAIIEQVALLKSEYAVHRQHHGNRVAMAKFDLVRSR